MSRKKDRFPNRTERPLMGKGRDSETDAHLLEEEKEDPGIAHLARHMHRLRESIPVNEKLKHDLKRQLYARQKAQKKQQTEQNAEQSAERSASRLPPKNLLRRRGHFLLLLGFLLVALCFIWWFVSDERIVVEEVSVLATYGMEDDIQLRLPPAVTEDGAEDTQQSAEEKNTSATVSLRPGGAVSVSSGGSGMLLAFGDVLYMKEPSSNDVQPLFSVRGAGAFHHPAFANQSNQAAVVVEDGERSEVWWMRGDLETPVRVLYTADDAELGPIYWSADDRWLSVARNVNGMTEEVLIDVQGGRTISIPSDRTAEPADDSFVHELQWPKRDEVDLLPDIHWSREGQRLLAGAEELHADRNVAQDRMTVAVLKEEQLIWMDVKVRDGR